MNSNFNMFITSKKLKSFLKKYSIEEFKFKFLPVDIHFCLSENEEIIEKVKNFLVRFNQYIFYLKKLHSKILKDEYYNKENKSSMLTDEDNSE
jgi:hypothetical protein